VFKRSKKNSNDLEDQFLCQQRKTLMLFMI
jgi:hypothetical protein